VLSVSALPNLSPTSPSIAGDFIEIRQHFARDDTAQVPTVMSRGPSPSQPHSIPGLGSWSADNGRDLRFPERCAFAP
jgi:hypothetical protein